MGYTDTILKVSVAPIYHTQDLGCAVHTILAVLQDSVPRKHVPGTQNPEAVNPTCGAKILLFDKAYIWVVLKIMVPFWVPNIMRHLLFRVPKKGP